MTDPWEDEAQRMMEFVFQATVARAVKERDEEIARLREENTRLRAALDEAG